MKKILVIGGGAYQVPLIRRIRELGYSAYCVDKNEKAAGFSEADGYRCVDILDEDACLAYAGELQINGVATYGATITLPTVSYIGSALNLPSLPYTTSKLACNKYKIKKQLIEHGCNTRGIFEKFNDIQEALKANIQFPCVVKPSDGSGSKGVTIVHNRNEYETAICEGFAAARFGEIYIESFFAGDEYSVEAFVNNGDIYVYAIVRTTFERHGTGNSNIAYGHTTPPGIDSDRERTITEEILKAVRILEINMGSVNFDVIVSKDDGKAYIIDCGIRIGQNLIASHIIPLSRGVNEMDMYISQTLGEHVDPVPKRQECIATRLLIGEPGTITKIEPMQQYIGQNGIVDIVMRKQAGDKQRVYTDKSDNCGWVLCTGATPEEAESNAEKARISLLKSIIIQ